LAKLIKYNDALEEELEGYEGNLKKIKIWICNFILMNYWIEIIVFCFSKGLDI